MKIQIEVKQSEGFHEIKFTEIYKVVWFKKDGGKFVSKIYLKKEDAESTLEVEREIYTEDSGYIGGVVMSDSLFV